MKRFLFAGMALSLAFTVVSCGGGRGGSSSANTSGGGDSGGGDSGGGTGTTCSLNDPLEVKGTCYAYCSKDKSFCVKDDEMPSQLIPNKAIKKCSPNSILIDDQCQQVTFSIRGDKNTIYYDVYGNTTKTSLVSSVDTYDPIGQSWKNSSFKLKYLTDKYGLQLQYYWQSNITDYVFPNFNTSGYDISSIDLQNADKFSPYDHQEIITPIVVFGDSTYDTSKYTYSSFEAWCDSLNNEWIKLDDPVDPANPPRFMVQKQDDLKGGNYIFCSANTDYASHRSFKNRAPYLERYQVRFECNYNNDDDCRVNTIGEY